jgi:hypothetical protein
MLCEQLGVVVCEAVVEDMAFGVFGFMFDG